MVRTVRAIYLAVLPQILINIYFYFLKHLFTSFSTSHKSHKVVFFYAITAVLCFLLYFHVFKLQSEAVEWQSCLKYCLVILLVELYIFGISQSEAP